jgi:hypothetical protein
MIKRFDEYGKKFWDDVVQDESAALVVGFILFLIVIHLLS